MSELRDAQWLELQSHFLLYRQGDERSTRVLFEGVARALRPYFRVRLSNHADAEDLLQATLLKIHFARDRFHSELSLKTWVFTVAGRCLIDHWRAEPDHHPEDTGIDEGVQPPADPAWRWDLNQEMNQALNQLRPDDRSIVYLSGVEGFSMAEIAVSLGMTESAVKVRAHRSYVKLRGILK